MNLVGETLERFLGKRPYTSVYFSEAPRFSLIGGLLIAKAIDSDRFGSSPLVQLAGAVGFHPILLISYDFCFQEDVAAVDLKAFIADRWKDVPFRIKIFFADKNNALEIFLEFDKKVQQREASKNTDGPCVHLSVSAKKYEHLRAVYFSQEPIPGIRANA